MSQLLIVIIMFLCFGDLFFGNRENTKSYINPEDFKKIMNELDQDENK